MHVAQKQVIARTCSHTNTIPCFLNAHARRVMGYKKACLVGSEARQLCLSRSVIFDTATDEKETQIQASSCIGFASIQQPGTIDLAACGRSRSPSTTGTASSRFCR